MHGDDRTDFAERIRRQLAARYRDIDVTVDPGRFAVRLNGPGLATSVPLAPLHNDCLRDAGRTPTLIATWVAGVARQLTSSASVDFAASGLLWCVRSRTYLDGLGRNSDLAIHQLGGDLVAFVAETLPGSIMRGIPREEWTRRDMTEEHVRTLAGANTARRFLRVTRRLQTAGGVPRDGWRLGGDALFQGSILMVPELLSAFAACADGDVVLGVPERSLVLAIPRASDGIGAFRRRVNQAYREAMAPCSAELLVTDGATVTALDESRASREGGGLMAWLRR